MKTITKRLFCVFLSGMLSLFPLHNFIAYSDSARTLDIDNVTQTILSFFLSETGCKNEKEFINDVAAENAGGMYDWLIFALMQSGKNYDFSAFAKALSENALSADRANAVEKERFALLLSAFEGNEDYITDILDTSTGGLGIMSYIYALFIINNGFMPTDIARDDIISEILSSRCRNGSWGLNKEAGIPDVTAMAIQALAPYYKTDKTVKSAVDKALASLSASQSEDGGFFSYGCSNAESCCQVIIALCSLGIDPATDERFIKNGRTLTDALFSFSLPDGSFEHIKGKGYNFKATEQALLAFTALNRANNGLQPLFCLDSHQKVPLGNSYAVLLIFVVCIIFLLLTIIFAKRKNKLSNLFAVLLILTVIGGFFLCADIQTPEEYHKVTEASGDSTITVFMSVNCSTVKEHSAEKEYITEDGTILIKTPMTLPVGSTVYDCLVYASKKYNIQFENKSLSAASAYISGINYLYEFDYGPLSGWIYRVNGVSADSGCSEYTLSDGDVIEWLYTCSLGDDLK